VIGNWSCRWPVLINSEIYGESCPAPLVGRQGSSEMAGVATQLSARCGGSSGSLFEGRRRTQPQAGSDAGSH